MEHELKTDPLPFDAIAEGVKTCELRRNDRPAGYATGDTLRLRETRYSAVEMRHGRPLEYTGREEIRRITHVLHGGYGLESGWSLLSLGPNVQIEGDARLLAQLPSNAGLGVAVPPAPTLGEFR